jgi:Type VI secretion system (T6SS), amidase effector protein 4
MSRQLPALQSLWDNYPNNPDGAAVSRMIGGKVEINAFENTCVVRMSRAFNFSGHPVPGPTAARAYGLNVVSGADKRWYAYRVSEWHKYMVANFGQPISVRNPGGVPSEFRGKGGVIEFIVAFNDATGHFDIWSGGGTRYREYFARAAVVNLWVTASSDLVITTQPPV